MVRNATHSKAAKLRPGGSVALANELLASAFMFHVPHTISLLLLPKHVTYNSSRQTMPRQRLLTDEKIVGQVQLLQVFTTSQRFRDGSCRVQPEKHVTIVEKVKSFFLSRWTTR